VVRIPANKATKPTMLRHQTRTGRMAYIVV
jgi:hypothetical protein